MSSGFGRRGSDGAGAPKADAIPPLGARTAPPPRASEQPAPAKLSKEDRAKATAQAAKLLTPAGDSDEDLEKARTISRPIVAKKLRSSLESAATTAE